jgi:hypothetical protein
MASLTAIRYAFAVGAVALATTVIGGCDRQAAKVENFNEARKFIALSASKLYKRPAELPYYRSSGAARVRRTILDFTDTLRPYAKHRIQAIATASQQLVRRFEDQAKILLNIAEIENLISRNTTTIAPPELVAGLCLFEDKQTQECRTNTSNALKNVSLRKLRSNYHAAYDRILGEFAGIWTKSVLPHLDQNIVAKTQPRIQMDFDECWCAENKRDVLALTNKTGDAWENVVMWVQVFDKDQRYYQFNWHTVDRWAPGETLYASYFKDLKYYRPRTFPSVGSLSVTLWGTNIAKQTFSYRYQGKERNRDLKRNMSGVRASKVVFQPFKKGVLFDDHRGVAITLGKSIAAPHTVRIILSRPNRRPFTMIRSRRDWAAGKTVKFIDKQLQFRPTNIQATILFDAAPGTYAHELGRWRVPQ